MDYLLAEVGRVERLLGNLQADSIGGAFLKGSRMAKLNVSTISTAPGAENPRSSQMYTSTAKQTLSFHNDVVGML